MNLTRLEISRGTRYKCRDETCSYYGEETCTRVSGENHIISWVMFIDSRCIPLIRCISAGDEDYNAVWGEEVAAPGLGGVR